MKQSEWVKMVNEMFAEVEQQAAEQDAKTQVSLETKLQDTLIEATMRCKAADQQQEIADATYKPAFLDLDMYRQWEVEEDIAKAARRKARTAAWEATRAYLNLTR